MTPQLRQQVIDELGRINHTANSDFTDPGEAAKARALAGPISEQLYAPSLGQVAPWLTDAVQLSPADSVDSDPSEPA